MNRDFPGRSAKMSALIDFKAAREDRLHLIVGKIRVASGVLSELAGVIGDKTKTGTVRIENLTATGTVDIAAFIGFECIADADKSLVLAQAGQLPWHAARFGVCGDAQPPTSH